MEIKDFRDLKTWKQGKQLVLEIYLISKKFPRHEVFGLVTQMRRAAISIPSNIAEGFNRHYKKEYIRFLYIALGSCAELETQTEIAFELQYMTDRDMDKLLEQIDHEAKMIRNQIKKLEYNSFYTSPEPRAPSPEK